MGPGTCSHGDMGAQNKGRPLALKAGGRAGPLIQRDSHGSGDAIWFPDVSSHIPAPSKSQAREKPYLGPLALPTGKPLCGLPVRYV